MARKTPSRTGLSLDHIELTEKQKRYCEVMTDYKTKVVFLSGCAGSSKTYLAVYAALFLYNKDKRKNISYIRTLVETSDRTMGFLKGDQNAKFNEYLAPLGEKLDEMLTNAESVKLKSNGVLSGFPINFVRGQDWKNRVAIFDEAQNADINALMLAMTRLNKGTTLFICGDSSQKDIKNSGFSQLSNLFDNEESRSNGIYNLKFDRSDIMRDPVVGFILDKVETIL